jgi:DNA-binding transcriptional regulator YiaG
MDQTSSDAQRIKGSLDELGMSQGAFSRETGYSANTISRWMTGKTKPARIVLKYLDLRVRLHRLSKGAE